MIFLVFETQGEAQTAADKIANNMGCSIRKENGYRADKWADPVETADGKFAFPRPDSRVEAIAGKTIDQAMDGVEGYTESETVEWPEIDL